MIRVLQSVRGTIGRLAMTRGEQEALLLVAALFALGCVSWGAHALYRLFT